MMITHQATYALTIPSLGFLYFDFGQSWRLDGLELKCKII